MRSGVAEGQVHVPDAHGKLDKALDVLAVDVLHPGREDHRQPGAVGHVVDPADLVLDHVRAPIGDPPGAQQAVVGDRPGPHDLGARLVIAGVRDHPRAEVDHRFQGGLAQPVGQIHLGGAGEVALQDVGGDVGDAAGGLVGRQGEGQFRVEDGEARVDQGAVEGALQLALLVGDHRAESLDSLPAAAMVRMTPTGRAACTLALPSKKSHTSPA